MDMQQGLFSSRNISYVLKMHFGFYVSLHKWDKVWDK